MSYSYAWVIDKDYLAEPGSEPGVMSENAATIKGPRDAPEHLLRQLDAGEGRLFRLYDDDGELYYQGRIVTDHPPGWDLQDEHFGPLSDFGTPNAGATDIYYLHGKRWVQL